MWSSVRFVCRVCVGGWHIFCVSSHNSIGTTSRCSLYNSHTMRCIRSTSPQPQQHPRPQLLPHTHIHSSASVWVWGKAKRKAPKAAKTHCPRTFQACNRAPSRSRSLTWKQTQTCRYAFFAFWSWRCSDFCVHFPVCCVFAVRLFCGQMCSNTRSHLAATMRRTVRSSPYPSLKCMCNAIVIRFVDRFKLVFVLSNCQYFFRVGKSHRCISLCWC